MRLRNVKNASSKVESSAYIITNPKEYRGKFATLFKKNQPLSLEIGMGKGDFLIGMAERCPDVNFIGIERYPSVILRAVQKLEGKDLPNVKLICMDAKEVDEVFDHEISTLYLNFSDPWPKTRHTKRRLTSDVFMAKYESVFLGQGRVIQKTDNIDLFAYSIEQLSKHDYMLEKVTLNLAKTDLFNVETEYEHKFKKLGAKINYVEAVKRPKK